MVSCTVGIITRRLLYPLKDVKSGPALQAEGSAEFGLTLQNDNMEVVSAGVVNGKACSY